MAAFGCGELTLSTLSGCSRSKKADIQKERQSLTALVGWVRLMRVKPWVTITSAGKYFNKRNYMSSLCAPSPNPSGFEQVKKNIEGSQPMPRERLMSNRLGMAVMQTSPGVVFSDTLRKLGLLK